MPDTPTSPCRASGQKGGTPHHFASGIFEFSSTKGPRCARSASTSRTVTRGRQPATRVLPLRGSSRYAAVLRMTAAPDRAGSACGPAGRLAHSPHQDAGGAAAPLSRSTVTADSTAGTGTPTRTPEPAPTVHSAGQYIEPQHADRRSGRMNIEGGGLRSSAGERATRPR